MACYTLYKLSFSYILMLIRISTLFSLVKFAFKYILLLGATIAERL